MSSDKDEQWLAEKQVLIIWFLKAESNKKTPWKREGKKSSGLSSVTDTIKDKVKDVKDKVVETKDKVTDTTKKQ